MKIKEILAHQIKLANTLADRYKWHPSTKFQGDILEQHVKLGLKALRGANETVMVTAIQILRAYTDPAKGGEPDMLGGDSGLKKRQRRLINQQTHAIDELAASLRDEDKTEQNEKSIQTIKGMLDKLYNRICK